MKYLKNVSQGFSMEKQVYVKNKLRINDANRTNFVASWNQIDVNLLMANYKKLSRTKRLHELIPNDFSKVLASLTVMRTPKMALKPVQYVLNDMLEQRINPDMRDHHNILAVYYLAEEYSKVVDHFESMRYNYKLKPDVKCFNFVIASYHAIQNHQKVVETYNNCCTFWPASQFLNMDGYSFLIESYGMTQNFQKILSLYNTLDEKLKDSMIEIKPEIYEALIRAYGYCGEYDCAVQLFEKVGANKVLIKTPHLPAHYDAIIEASLECEKPNIALKYWNELLDICDQWNENFLNLPPRSRTIQDDWEPYSEFPHSPLKLKGYFSPYPTTVTRIMEHFYTSKMYRQAIDLWLFCRRSMPSNGHTYELAALSYWEIGEKNTSQHILYEMTQKRFHPRSDLYQKIKEYRMERKTEK
jgi:tetratricopeptide (TPR) repeat protein